MTEKDANTRWCPLFGSHKYKPEDTYFIPNMKCIASDCMMWTWKDIKHINGDCGLIKEEGK